MLSYVGQIWYEINAPMRRWGRLSLKTYTNPTLHKPDLPKAEVGISSTIAQQGSPYLNNIFQPSSSYRDIETSILTWSRAPSLFPVLFPLPEHKRSADNHAIIKS